MEKCYANQFVYKSIFLVASSKKLMVKCGHIWCLSLSSQKWFVPVNFFI